VRFLLTAVLAVAAGCATLKKDQTVCPEYRNLRCAAGTFCDLDRSRGCKVCRCQSVNTNEDPGPDDTRPPDVQPPLAE
jgi:hypothetical protein